VPEDKKLLFGLFSKYGKRSLKDCVDFDYVDKLSDDDKDWLNNFSLQYYHTNFSNESAIPHTVEEKRVAYKRDNARRRDIFNTGLRVGLNKAIAEGCDD
jgi:hypothetical protein